MIWRIILKHGPVFRLQFEQGNIGVLEPLTTVQAHALLQTCRDWADVSWHSSAYISAFFCAQVEELTGVPVR